jgi:hypothetical protein
MGILRPWNVACCKIMPPLVLIGYVTAFGHRLYHVVVQLSRACLRGSVELGIIN